MESERIIKLLAYPKKKRKKRRRRERLLKETAYRRRFQVEIIVVYGVITIRLIVGFSRLGWPTRGGKRNESESEMSRFVQTSRRLQERPIFCFSP